MANAFAAALTVVMFWSAVEGGDLFKPGSMFQPLSTPERARQFLDELETIKGLIDELAEEGREPGGVLVDQAAELPKVDQTSEPAPDPRTERRRANLAEPHRERGRRCGLADRSSCVASRPRFRNERHEW